MSSKVTEESKPATLLERISDSQKQFKEWPDARQKSALREAESSASYWIRVQNSISTPSTKNSSKKDL